jgi:N-methylhydantoinase A
MHACEAAMEADLPEVLVPLYPGHYSAFGMLGANLRLDRREIMLGLLSEIDPHDLSAMLRRIGDELVAQLSGRQRDGVEIDVRHALALRYRGQDHTVKINAPYQGRSVPGSVAAQYRSAFEREYTRRYGHLDPYSDIEVVELEVVGERLLPRVVAEHEGGAEGSTGTLDACWGGDETPVGLAVLPRGSLSVGNRIDGPAVVYEEGSTTVLPPGTALEVVEGGTLRIRVPKITGTNVEEDTR